MHSKDSGRFIVSREAWKEEYKKDKTKVWVIVELSNGVSYYFSDFKQWYELTDQAAEGNLKVVSVSLQFRSNKMVNKIPDNCDGVYLIRSALGSPGAETIDTITLGYINKQEVLKRVIQIPALIETNRGTDSIDNCFKEGMLLWQENY